MELILQIVRDPAYTVSKQMLRVFGESGGTIGRSLHCHWVLPDPKCYVSGNHCAIEHDGAGFWLRDLSRNGVVLNGSRQRVDPKRPVLIRSGDRIQLGLYEILAHVHDRGAAYGDAVSSSTMLGSRPASSVRATVTSHADAGAVSSPESLTAEVVRRAADDGEPSWTQSHVETTTLQNVDRNLEFADEPYNLREDTIAEVEVGARSVVANDFSAIETGEHPVATGESTDPDPLRSTVLELTGDHPVLSAETSGLGRRGSTTPEESIGHPSAEESPSGDRLAPLGTEGALAETATLDESVGDALRGSVSLDTKALREFGLVPPERERRLITNQFRHIKRRVIPGAFGKGDQAIPGGRLVMVTSALPGEGKTFCSINLALSLAREKDLSVLLVDADVRNPSLSRRLGVSEEPGLLNLLADDRLDVKSLVLETDHDSFSFLPAGQTEDDAATELLASARMTEIASSVLRDDPGRIVVLDGPPLLLTNEARVLTGVVGQILLIVAAGVTPRPAVEEAVQYIGQDKFVGLVLNQSKVNRPGSYYGYGDYGYGDYA
jgi:exopolysaccharide/PEP-CTERM locus tyrosine autokinase